MAAHQVPSRDQIIKLRRWATDNENDDLFTVCQIALGFLPGNREACLKTVAEEFARLESM